VREALPHSRVAAVHCDHGLQDVSADWAVHCRRVCDGLGVPLVSERVTVRGAAGEGREAAARRARYALFEQVLGAGEYLLTAHHKDDQAETLLLRLLRGSGVDGLAAMTQCRAFGAGRLLRPLLGFSREQLAAYALEQRLDWVEDPTNAEIHADRNFIRLQVLPLLAQRWPGVAASLAHAAQQQGEAARVLEELAAGDLSAACAGGRPRVEILRALPRARVHNLLRYWIRMHGLSVPGRARLVAGVDALLSAAGDRAPALEWVDGAVRRYRECLYLTPPLPSPSADEWQWDGKGPLEISELGTLSAEAAAPGEGVAVPPEGFRVRLRRGGERCRPKGCGRERTLKNLLQEQGVPPWERERLPLVYAGERLAAVSDLWICEGFAPPRGKAGIVMRWTPRRDLCAL
jgi:tRNA(Ile)-lysidine synthase